tara:strand:+ start:993 stop:1898 length:906 start_codon:yes stop_codon:yes gene_type:complete
MKVINEYAKLKRVILGSSKSFGGTPELSDAYDPKSKKHIKNGTFPTQESIDEEMGGFFNVLNKNGIEVLRPKIIDNYNQIFARDIAIVIDDKFVIANMINDRSREIEALTEVISDFSKDSIIEAPEGVRFEGGDIMPHNEYLFIGYSEPEDFLTYKVARTNIKGVAFFKESFPSKKVKAFELKKSDTDPKMNSLHLDCCFQPFGLGHAIIHKEGFKNPEDAEWLINYFGEENCLFIDSEQMYNMGANLLSIDKDHVISEINLEQTNTFLESKGYTVEKIKYSEIAKMEGLLRCSTLPLKRD